MIKVEVVKVYSAEVDIKKTYSGSSVEEIKKQIIDDVMNSILAETDEDSDEDKSLETFNMVSKALPAPRRVENLAETMNKVYTPIPKSQVVGTKNPQPAYATPKPVLDPKATSDKIENIKQGLSKLGEANKPQSIAQPLDMDRQEVKDAIKRYQNIDNINDKKKKDFIDQNRKMLSIREIAEILGTSYGSVHYYVRKFEEEEKNAKRNIK